MPEPGGSERARGRGRPSTGAREAIRAAARELVDEGLGRLTTREVARRAGVSEGSVFYHFKDKAGLLQEVVEAGLEPVRELSPELLAAAPAADSLLQLASALESFFDHAMPALVAVQSDPVLRGVFAERLVAGDAGPHRGVRLLARHLIARSAGELNEAAAEAIGLMIVGASFLRSWQRHMAGAEQDETLPPLGDVALIAARLTDVLADDGRAGPHG